MRDLSFFKLSTQLVSFCFLLFFSKFSLIAAEIIEPNKISQLELIKKLQDRDLRLTPNERLWLNKNNIIKVAVKSGWMPIEFKLESENHAGLSIDYLIRLSDILQVKFEIVNYLDNTNTAQADIISGVTNKNLLNPNYSLLTQPFLIFPLAIYTNKEINKQLKIKTLDDLNSSTVAIFKGGFTGLKIKENYPKIKLVYVDVADDAFDKLKAGDIDAYIGNEMIIDYHISFNRLEFTEKSGLTPFTSTVSMAVRNDQPELASILEKELLAINSDKKELIEKWIVRDNKNNGIIIILLAFISIIFFAALTKYYRLKNAIKKNKAESQQQIWQQANFDHLTKLPNRHLLQTSLTQALDRASRSNLMVGILYIDLDNFKRVNDGCGHTIGDKLLVAAANRIISCVRSSDTTARIGGDEFMVIMTEMQDLNFLESTCQKILKSIESPFSIENNQFFISASIGISLYPEDSHSTEELFIYADQAMYEAKKSGRNRYQFFTKSMQDITTEKLSIANDLRSAIFNDEFIVYYQPILNLKDSTVNKAEALIRWNHPKKGLISPLEFISIAEEIGLIDSIGQWVLNQALKDLITIRTHLNCDFQLSINVSPNQFRQPENLLNWIKNLEKQGFSGDCFSLEITEGLLLEATSTVLDTLSAVRDAGISLSIDDFGTGYSALAYLKKFDVNYVKIDRSFINNLVNENYDSVLCEAIINMAHKLDIEIIAEGIETVDQKELLKQYRCNYGQGYLFAKPGTLIQLLECIDFLKKTD